MSEPSAPDKAEVTSTRALLKERARMLAQPVKPIAHSITRGIVVFSLGDERYGLETRLVHAAQPVPRITALPGAAPHVLGLSFTYGELLVVFDLRSLLGTARPAFSSSSRMLVLGEQSPELAIVADVVYDVQELQDADVFMPPATTAEEARPYLRGVTSQGVSIFDGAALLASAQLYVDEPSAAALV